MLQISCITPSYNKPAYVLDAVHSVVNQTDTQWDYLIIENSEQRDIVHILDKNVKDPRVTIAERIFSEEFRRNYYVPGFILNTYLDKMAGDIIMYLSDDDYFDPHCFQYVSDFFAAHPEAQVCYFGMQSVKGAKATGWQENGQILAKNKYPVGMNLDCVLDGGQVAFRKSCLAKLEKPYFVTDWQNASHCDGLFLNKLSEQFDFYPIDAILLTHRTTELSTHAEK